VPDLGNATSARRRRPRGVTRLGHLAIIILFACSLVTPRGEAPGLTRPPNPTCIAPPRPAAKVAVVRAFPRLHFDQPVSLVASRDWWFVAERRGRVWRFGKHDDVPRAELVLEISDRVDSSSEALGLLAIALHPAFETTGILFVSYTGSGGTVVTSRVSRFVSRDGGARFDDDREQSVLELDQIADYHLNADLRFGPDGYLYVGFGDGGPQGDPAKHAQDRNSLKGKILRLDVGRASPYAIPPDNPFARGGGRPEIWALGLRNPWRFAFDRKTGELWAGDVGGDRFEEIDRIVRGGNYGWNLREGRRCVQEGTCASANLIDPVLAVPHPELSSITFGLVYRGSAIPGLEGNLIYADFAAGSVWGVDPAVVRPAPRMLNNDGHAVVAFAEDSAGEPILVDYGGTLWRLVPGRTSSSDVPAMLSTTGCFHRGGRPDPALIAYDVNVPFWSDGASKRRWFAIPDGTTIRVDRDGRFVLPIGSVVAKEFGIGSTRVETRLFVRHDDGEWAGYTYRWDASQSDATLVPSAATGTVSSWPQPWYFPHRGECLRCHRAAGGHTLGLERAQLDRPIGNDNQLAIFERAGLLEGPVPAGRALPSSGATPEHRARAWLHANCSYCHRPEATGHGEMDLRFDASLAQMNVCDVTPRFGTYNIQNARRVVPGEPGRSMLWRRMKATGNARMPPLGTLRPDDQGVALVAEWIRGLETCGD
jgi:uncharacterized repeat protein (TIGR03806 family)